jgi:hypothetical protein
VKVFGATADYQLELGIYYFGEIQIDTAGAATLWISNTQVATATGRNATVTTWHLMAKNTSAAQTNQPPWTDEFDYSDSYGYGRGWFFCFKWCRFEPHVHCKDFSAWRFVVCEIQ